MRKKLRIAVPLVLGALTVGLLMASSASAIHPQPQGATPIRVPLVPAMKECPFPGTAGNHNGPLPLGSCNNPDTISTTVTLGNSTAGTARLGYLKISCTGCATPSVDVRLAGNWSDIVCKTAGSPAACTTAGQDYDPNSAPPFYTGGLNLPTNPNGTPPSPLCNPSPPNPAACAAGADMTATAEIPGSTSPAGHAIRITDHFNNTASTTPGWPVGTTGDPAGCSGGGTCSGTVVDAPFPVPVVCAATTSTPAIGSYCGTNTTANSLVPGVVVLGVKAVIRVGELRVLDSGPDGTRGNTDDQIAGVQGLYIP